MAAVNIEPGKPSHVPPLAFNPMSLQRIRLGIVDVDRAYGARIDPSSLREGEVFHAVPMKQPRQTEVSFDAARLGIDPVLLVVLPGELLLGGPRFRPNSRIL